MKIVQSHVCHNAHRFRNPVLYFLPVFAMLLRVHNVITNVKVSSARLGDNYDAWSTMDG